MIIDPSLYTRAPIVTAASGAALARALVAACPKGMPANVQKAARRLTKAAEEATATLGARQRIAGLLSDDGARLLDQEADVSWGSLRMRLLAWASLPPERFPEAKRAEQLVFRLFGAEGLTFLQSDYNTQSTIMSALLQRIDEDGLQPEIDALAGPAFLAQVRHVHERYVAMVSARLQRQSGEASENLAVHTRALQAAIVDYATKVCATIDPDDPATIEVAAMALRPIDAFREESARRLSARSPGKAPAGGDEAPGGEGAPV
ncbi:MAG TPA: hypothetical protein VFS43_46960 [Polyangiaceae bacterium]|nr:hypothetical protein [Polyangiaceae bacterium]